jgi:hypothetical protein
MTIRRKSVSLTDEKNDQTGFFDEFVFSCNDPSPRFSFSPLFLTSALLPFAISWLMCGRGS